ncbi:unnamed protein product [Protopolystoma xenopodis]|uniref:Calponin-homology (CH) domain-containing protein n=1 Tax=Protopolystoma xenopodis TaxID=117903 RepID=A0A3S5CNY7_9PLAT|nr:unnamed protein product [Protopolystoma xenopodis]
MSLSPHSSPSLLQLHGDARSARDALLLWCQRRTQGYAGVNVQNFTTSWNDGLAFGALLHHHCPELLEFNELDSKLPLKNLEKVFSLAQENLGVPRLLDPEGKSSSLKCIPLIFSLVVA